MDPQFHSSRRFGAGLAICFQRRRGPCNASFSRDRPYRLRAPSAGDDRSPGSPAGRYCGGPRNPRLSHLGVEGSGIYFALGLALATKHSAPIFFLFIGAVGGFLAIKKTSSSGPGRISRIAKVAAVLVAAWMILWSLYLFRFRESTSAQEVFNRPLAQKISDIGSPAYRAVLTTLSATHALPRAYIWGFADTIHAGLEGRAFQQIAFGHVYYNKAPWFFFPGIIGVKLPIGLLLLAISGILVSLHPRCLGTLRLPALIVLAASFCFLLVLRSGATYAGIRHALPPLVLLAILAGLASAAGFKTAIVSKTPRRYRFRHCCCFSVASASSLGIFQ